MNYETVQLQLLYMQKLLVLFALHSFFLAVQVKWMRAKCEHVKMLRKRHDLDPP